MTEAEAGREGDRRGEVAPDGDRVLDGYDPLREGHGFWPYWAPYITFLTLSSLTPKFPDAVRPWLLIVKPGITLALLIYFWSRGAYPELRGRLGARVGFGGGVLDVVMGIALALVWMAPYILFPSLRPDPDAAFDPAQLGAAREGLTIGLRLLGYAFVTPLFEELFVRSWVMRYADVWAERGDFRDVPLARFTTVSFVSTVVVFTGTHLGWEAWVALPWIVITNLWFYYRKSLWALILLHGVTNATLLAFAAFGGSLFHDADGSPISLWFFV